MWHTVQNETKNYTRSHVLTNSLEKLADNIKIGKYKSNKVHGDNEGIDFVQKALKYHIFK